MSDSHVLGVRMLSVAEAADHLAISKESVRRFIRRGELRSVSFGRRITVHPDDLIDFIESNRTATCA